MARILIKHGSPVHGKPTDTSKPLTLCTQDDYQVAIDLITRGADPSDLCRNEGETEFHAALRYGFVNQGTIASTMSFSTAGSSVLPQ